jgi:hypothetical protein
MQSKDTILLLEQANLKLDNFSVLFGGLGDGESQQAGKLMYKKIEGRFFGRSGKILPGDAGGI